MSILIFLVTKLDYEIEKEIDEFFSLSKLSAFKVY